MLPFNGEDETSPIDITSRGKAIQTAKEKLRDLKEKFIDDFYESYENLIVQLKRLRTNESKKIIKEIESQRQEMYNKITIEYNKRNIDLEQKFDDLFRSLENEPNKKLNLQKFRRQTTTILKIF